jgi:hypothetical protein
MRRRRRVARGGRSRWREVRRGGRRRRKTKGIYETIKPFESIRKGIR